MTSIIKAEQTARTTERILIKLYENILKEITLDADYPNQPNSLMMKYHKQVYDATRSAIQQVHLEALHYVGSTLNIDTYLTTTDIELIKAETQQAVNMFFVSLQRGAEVQQQHDFKLFLDELNKTQLYGGSLLDPIAGLLASFTRNAVSVITGAFSKSVASKTKQVGNLFVDVMAAKTGLPAQKQQLRWITQQDERVCDFCRPLHGEIFDIDDPSIPYPPDETHFNCRCFLEIVT